MKHWTRRLAAWAAVLLLALAMSPPTGHAVLSGVYFTAVNEQLLELNSETMPFLYGGVWYVSSRVFEGTDLGVNYARNYNANQAMLYTAKIDLRFDLDAQTITDKNGNTYAGCAIDRGGVIFFPLPLVCSRFGLRWSITDTETVPLIRVKSASAVLTDREFIDAAIQMRSRYSEYERAVTAAESSPPPGTVTPPEDDPPLAAEGQKVYLLIDSQSPEDTLALLDGLGQRQATFLLTAEEMESADLIRALVAGGHGVALEVHGETAEEIDWEIARARDLMWQSACAWLELVWRPDQEDTDALLAQLGCVQVRSELTASGGLSRASQAAALMRSIGRYREDVAVYLGGDGGGMPGLSALLEDLETGGYHVSAWRLTA